MPAQDLISFPAFWVLFAAPAIVLYLAAMLMLNT